MWERRGSERRVVRCGANFSIVHDVLSSHWAPGPLPRDSEPLHRVCTLARKMGARALLVEDAIERGDVREEVDALEATAGGEGTATAVALTFFSAPYRGANDVNPAEMIGQAIVVTTPGEGGTPTSHLFEAVVRVPRMSGGRKTPLLNNYVPFSRELSIVADGRDYRLEAVHFSQQNGRTGACAHSAVGSVMRCLRPGVDVRPATLNRLWNLRLPRSGASVQQIGQAFAAHGLRAIPYDLSPPGGRATAKADNAAWHHICSLVESGNPVLLSFETEGVAHVVTVVGYTINTDEWHPGASSLYGRPAPSVISSTLWIDHLIIHDDLLGPYLCLSRSWLTELTREDGRSTIRPQTAIAILPAEVVVTAPLAESIVESFLMQIVAAIDEEGWDGGAWWETLATGTSQVVLRTTLVRRQAYVDHLRSMRPRMSRRHAEIVDGMADGMPDLVWLCEISSPHLYAGSRFKLGEMLIRVGPFQPGEELDAVVGFRMPSLVGTRTEDGFAVRRFGVDGPVGLNSPPHPHTW